VQQQHMTLDQLTAMRGAPVYDKDGDKIGSVEEIFYDHQTREPEWIGIGTGLLGTKRVLVPTQGASVTGDGITVRYEKDHVKDSPDIDSDEISERLERELYSYYDLQPSERRSESVLPEGERGTGRVAEGDTVTRAEEELQVGKREEEAGRARLRKWVETEPVEMDVDLKRETARVTREQVDRPVSDAEIGEDEVEVELREEQPVVQKQTVAKERVGLEKDVETERETVADEVRKERVEVEGDVDDRR
jgi:stress response protein YsnF